MFAKAILLNIQRLVWRLY